MTITFPMMATPASACVSEAEASTSPSVTEFLRQPTLQKLKQLTTAEKNAASRWTQSQNQCYSRVGAELSHILGRQRVQIDQNAIHFVSEPARRRSSVVKSAPPKDNLDLPIGDDTVKKNAAEIAQHKTEDVPHTIVPVRRTESIFRMAPAAAGRTIIARVGAPRADCVTLRNNPLIMRRFTVDSLTEFSENEQEDSGAEEDAEDAAILERKEGGLQKKISCSPNAANVPKESRATNEQKKKLLATVASTLHAEIEQSLKEGEAVVTTEPYNADEPTNITLAVTKIQNMAAAVERLTTTGKPTHEPLEQTTQSTQMSTSDAVTMEEFQNGTSNVFLTEADFNVLESLQQAFVHSNLIIWMDHMKTIYMHGVRLLKVNALGKMFIRIVTVQDGYIQLLPINAQAKSRRTVALAIVETVKLGKNSREFRALKGRIEAGEEPEEAK